jgi:hypothetical protein
VLGWAGPALRGAGGARAGPTGAGVSDRRCASGGAPTAAANARVREEMMGSQEWIIVGKSQPVLMMINPIIFTRTRSG